MSASEDKPPTQGGHTSSQSGDENEPDTSWGSRSRSRPQLKTMLSDSDVDEGAVGGGDDDGESDDDDDDPSGERLEGKSITVLHISAFIVVLSKWCLQLLNENVVLNHNWTLDIF